MLTMLLSLALAATAPAAVTPRALVAHYGSIRSLSADVVQVKEGKFWARPLESHIRLRYTPDRVVWETVSPVRSTVVIQGSAFTVTGPDGRTRDLGPMASDPRFASLVRFLRALLAVDLDTIERDFALAYGPGQIIATPRESSPPLFKSILLQFDPGLELTSIELATDTERTRLSFSNVKRDAAAPSSDGAREHG